MTHNIQNWTWERVENISASSQQEAEEKARNLGVNLGKCLSCSMDVKFASWKAYRKVYV